MNIKWISIPALALCIGAPATLKAKASEAQPAPSLAQYQDQDRDWDRPPDNYRNDAQRRGFHEGIEAARHDFQDRRHADADDHEMYKHPPVEGDARHAFREGFKEGYRRAMEHMRHDRNRDHDRDNDQPHF